MTVYEKLRKILPNENFIYFGDLKNCPYGQKSKEELIDLTSYIFNFFECQKVKAVVMACNTTSAMVYDFYKDKYSFKIYPIIQSCANIIAKFPIERIGVFATMATIQSHAYSNEIKKYNSKMEVFEMACPSWVRIVEKNLQKDSLSVQIIQENLNDMMKNLPQKIILGCTHYPYLLDILSKFTTRETFIDPSIYFSEFVKKDLEKLNLLNKSEKTGEEKIYVSANPDEFRKASKMFYELKSLPEIIEFESV